MNWLLWLEFLTTVGGAVAKSQGADERSVRYLQVAGDLARATQATDADLAELSAKYQEEVANDTPTTASELDAIAERIAARSAEIQGP